MYRNLASVGGLTLLSRGTGFVRDVVVGAVLGAGASADAFFVAFRLPNHFRAIFGEGAFNAAYVPSYARVLETEGPSEAKRFSSQIFTLLLASQIVFLALAWTFMPTLVRLLAPGFDADPPKFELAVRLTRITFPYLLFVTLVTLHSGTLNAHRKFTAAAFAPVLLNVAMVAFLGLAFLFPSAAEAASYGVTVSGALQLGLMMWAARRQGVLEKLTWPRSTRDVRRFFAALGPAVIGSAGVQIALFADTIIASMLPTGAVSSIYYADRIYQLPVGVIGIAAGTVLLPEMSRCLAAGDRQAAFQAQNRTMALTIALTTPFCVAFLCVPVMIMRGVFVRGAFTDAAAQSAGMVLGAYGLGLFAVVLIRSAVASFQARGDTTTPMVAALVAVAFNVALKIALYRTLGTVGLAGATAAGAWINLAILVVLAVRRGDMRPDRRLIDLLIAVFLAADALAAIAVFGAGPLQRLAMPFGSFRATSELLVLAVIGMTGYLATLLIGLRVLGIKLARR
ncbi:MAG: murein biosynthesis integral membrane protein MurJ [Methylobacteriaceae bacterium]|nr:murein biosynthesis integral membrane protein MurJ [Methylobacteriaceae bacterium]MBV9246217.1 murein biosynthesis integral membrane protein MurJ [Methylobacteriaceae bacterium]